MSEISYIKGSVLEPIGSGDKMICHCCNDIGVMGAGVALAIAKKWPEVKAKYLYWANHWREKENILGEFKLGAVQFVWPEKNIVIANMIGQKDIRRGIDDRPPIRYSALRACLGNVCMYTKCMHNPSIHLPRIGCGLAGGSWDKVERIIIEKLVDEGLPVTVYDL